MSCRWGRILNRACRRNTESLRRSVRMVPSRCWQSPPGHTTYNPFSFPSCLFFCAGSQQPGKEFREGHDIALDTVTFKPSHVLSPARQRHDGTRGPRRPGGGGCARRGRGVLRGGFVLRTRRVLGGWRVVCGEHGHSGHGGERSRQGEERAGEAGAERRGRGHVPERTARTATLRPRGAAGPHRAAIVLRRRGPTCRSACPGRRHRSGRLR